MPRLLSVNAPPPTLSGIIHWPAHSSSSVTGSFCCRNMEQISQVHSLITLLLAMTRYGLIMRTFRDLFPLEFVHNLQLRWSPSPLRAIWYHRVSSFTIYVLYLLVLLSVSHFELGDCLDIICIMYQVAIIVLKKRLDYHCLYIYLKLQPSYNFIIA